MERRWWKRPTYILAALPTLYQNASSSLKSGYISLKIVSLVFQFGQLCAEEPASAKAAGELMLLVHKMKVNDAVAEKAAELNSHILSLAQEGLAILAQNQALLHEKAELERKIVEIEDWRDEAAKYEKLKIAPGVIVYAPKAEVESAEPFHWICPNCYGNKRTSLVEREGIAHQALAVYRCFSCSLKVTLNGGILLS